MKRTILFVLLFAALKVAGQTTGYLRFDTVRIMKQNGTCELYIINKTKDSLGILTNIGGGLTSFIKPRQLTDSSFKVGNDTIVIRGTGGSSIVNASGSGDTLWNGSAIKRLDHDATLTFSINTNKILMGVDTIAWVSSIPRLRDTAATLRSLINLKPNVYNIVDPKYGAIEDAKRIFDGAITAASTTFTSASANFTAADVGKSIRVNYAGPAGIDLVTTIAGFTNSTTVTLSNAASSTVSADTAVYGTDNTVAIQKAIDTCFKHGGGTVLVPNRTDYFFLVAGQLRNNVLGVNPNSQIVIPMAYNGGTGINAVENRTAILIEGETGPEFSPNGPLSDIIPGVKGSVIYSIIDGTGNAPAVFASKAPFQTITGDSINYTYVGFKNFTIITPANRNGGGTSIGGINMYWGTPFLYENLVITADGKGKTSVRPVNNVAGLITNKINSETQAVVRQVDVRLYKYGICTGDHANLDQAEVFLCDKAFVFMNNFGATQANRIMPVWSITSVYVPSSDIMGLPGSGVSAGVGAHFKIDMLHSEVYAGDATGWWNYTYIFEDSSNKAHGSLTYHTVRAGVGIDNTLFNKWGGNSFNCVQIDKPAWFHSGNDISAQNTGDVNIITPSNLNIQATTSVIDHGFFVVGASAGFGTSSVSYPLTRNGITVKALNNDGAEIIVQPSGASGTSGTAIVVSGNTASFYNRLNGNLHFGSNNSTSAIVIDNANKVGINNTTPSWQFHVTGSVGFDLSGDATGDIFYRNSGGSLSRLGIGTANQQLRVNAGATAPEWFTPSSSGITSINSQSGPAITIDNGGSMIITNPSANTIRLAVDPTSSVFSRMLQTYTTDANNTGTSETDLYSTNVAGGILAATGNLIRFEYAGQFNDNTSTATLKVYFGGSQIGNTAALTVSAAGAWAVSGFVMRTGTTTGRAYVTFHSGSTTLPEVVQQVDLSSQDFTITNILKITGQAGGAGGGTNDITSKIGKVSYEP